MRVWSLVIGVVTSALVVGAFVVVHVGPSVFAACLVTAALFFAAGFAFGRFGALGIALGGVLPIVGLALGGIAFASLVWAGPIVVVAAAFAFAGAAARDRRGAAIAAAGWLVLLFAGRPLIGAVTSMLSTDRVARPVAPFVLTTAERAVPSSELRGRVVVLAFWATWCEPCAIELPELAALADRYRGDPRVALWWINAGRGDDTLALAQRFAAEQHVALPLAFDGGGLASRLGFDGLPALAVLDADGVLRVVHRGYDRSEALAARLGDEIDALVSAR